MRGWSALRSWSALPRCGSRIRLRSRRSGSEPSISSSCSIRAQKTMRPVAIVDIDEKSLADPKLGQWPWPRTRIADIITNLTRLGAVVIAFDAVFSEPDRLNPDVAADTFRNLDEETRDKLRALPSNDRIFADAIRSSRVVLGESGWPDVRADLDKTLAGDGTCDARRGAAALHVQFPGAAAQRAGAGAGGRRARPVHDQARARRHCPPRADDHAGAGHHHAVADLRDAAGRDRHRHDPDQGRQGRHQEHRRQGLSDSDRPQRPALGALCAQRSLDLCLGRRRAGRPRRAGQDRGQAGADRHLGDRPQRHQDHAGVAGDARRRDPRPGAGERADRRGGLAAELRHRRRILQRADAWDCW